MAPDRAAGTRTFLSLAPRFLVVALLIGGLTTCGGDSSGPDPDPVDNTVASVTVSPSSGTLEAIGATTTFSATGRNAAGTTVSGTTFTWSSSSGTVAAVSDAGVVTAIGNGTATITATATGTSASGAATVTVQQAVSSVSVSPQDGSIEIGATVQLTATAEDSGGATVEGASFTWASSDMAIATVSTGGLVTGVSDGDVTITATSGSANGTAPVTVIRNDLEINADQNLEGDVTADDFTIAAGVTVTATDDLTIDATGEVMILGTIVGDCVTVAIQGDTAVTVMGTLDNTCNAGGIGDSISVVADGELTLEDATIISSGDMEFSNDPTLTDDDFPEPSSGASGVSGMDDPSRAGRGVPFTRVNRTTIRYKGGETGPNPADPGEDNTNGDGGDGDDGRNVRFRLRGNAEFAGETILNGQSGGWGGDGSKTANTDVEAKGGKGGDAGRIRIWVTGTLTYMGGDNVVRSGSGGDGGHGTATATTNPDPAKAPSAEAMGGQGGEPGLIDIRAGGGITIANAGGLTLEIGRPGHGGNADATAADGVDATATKPAQDGGDATADGGVGGTTPNKQLQRIGNVTGPNPIVQGINGAPLKAGKGGDATATAGDGGNGIEPNPHGADGGSPGASAGTGGEYKLKGLDGMLLGDGGDGGKATFRKGNGGDGWDDCEDLNNPKPGGNGGKGGDATGQDGDGGVGKAKGMPGGVEIENVGNGGDGKREDGALGPNGTDATNNFGGKNLIGTNFQPGQPGGKCPAVPPINTYLQLNQIPNNFGLVDFGSYVVDLIDDVSQAIGQATIATFGTAGNHFFGADPDRVGLFSNTNGWDVLLPEFVVGMNQFTPEEVEICLLNTTVDEMNPATLEQIDGEGQVIDTYFWTSLASPEQRPGPSMMSTNTGCVTRQVLIEARIIRLRAPMGRFGDFGRFRFTGPPPGP